MPVGIDDDGRERLEFIDGDVPTLPYPEWSQSDIALVSIAELLRGLHDASRVFDPRGLTWNDLLADPAGGTIVGHNDVEPSNVVFRDGRAVAFIDFEFAAPGRPIYDLAQLGRLTPHPESVPINMLVQVEGTPLHGTPRLDPLEFVRVIALARIMMPASYVRLSAGREGMSAETQALCFFAGANSIFYGEKLLTTPNPVPADDRALFERLGIRPEVPAAAPAPAED